MKADTVRMTEWLNQQLLGKKPTDPFKLGISKLPSTPVKKPGA